MEQLRFNPNFKVWEEDNFQVPTESDSIADSLVNSPELIFNLEKEYNKGNRTIQVDAIVYNKSIKSLGAYIIKRGFGFYDRAKRRSMLRDLLCLHLLLKSYGQQRSLNVSSAKAHIIFYYGQRSIDKPFSLTGDELDDHFSYPVNDAVKKVNSCFRDRLFSILDQSDTLD